MKTQKISVPSLAVKSGLLISVVFVLYFLLMKALGLLHVTEYRFLNVLILIAGLVITFRNYMSETAASTISYLNGLVLGVLTSLSAFITFTIFIFIYFTFIDPEILLKIGESAVMLGNSPSAVYASIAVMVEGFTSGLIISFILMQYYKSGYYTDERKQQKAT